MNTASPEAAFVQFEGKVQLLEKQDSSSKEIGVMLLFRKQHL